MVCILFIVNNLVNVLDLIFYAKLLPLKTVYFLIAELLSLESRKESDFDFIHLVAITVS